ncbi:MAG: hypothetical protein QXK12_07725 [Candidatus Nezhaarchaeales archaeon]
MMRKVSVSWREMLDAVSDIEKYGLDFVNALTLQIMKKNNVTEIYTSNRGFDGME